MVALCQVEFSVVITEIYCPIAQENAEISAPIYGLYGKWKDGWGGRVECCKVFLQVQNCCRYLDVNK